MPSNVVSIYEPSTYVVRVITEDMYTFIVDASNPKDAEKQCLSRTTDTWLPVNATSMRRLASNVKRVSKVNVPDELKEMNDDPSTHDSE